MTAQTARRRRARLRWCPQCRRTGSLAVEFTPDGPAIYCRRRGCGYRRTLGHHR